MKDSVWSIGINIQNCKCNCKSLFECAFTCTTHYIAKLKSDMYYYVMFVLRGFWMSTFPVMHQENIVSARQPLAVLSIVKRENSTRTRIIGISISTKTMLENPFTLYLPCGNITVGTPFSSCSESLFFVSISGCVKKCVSLRVATIAFARLDNTFGSSTSGWWRWLIKIYVVNTTFGVRSLPVRNGYVLNTCFIKRWNHSVLK